MMFSNIIMTPLGAGFLVGLIVMVYLVLMTYNIYLPTILILSVVLAVIVYQSQSQCYNRNLSQPVTPTSSQ